MAKKRQRFHSPPPTAPISTARDTSLAFRLNLGFFFRQLCIFVVLDLLLAGMALCGLILYGENRCADVAALVEERGVPTQDALAWMEASDYTITLLDGEPTGYPVPVFAWLPIREETADGLRLWDLSHYYQIQMPSETTPYAITVNLTGIFQTLYWAGVVVLVFQGIFLLTSLFGNNRSIRKVLRPLQELPATQKELRSLAQSINAMLERINRAYSAQARFVSDASHELRTPIAVIQGYAALLDRWGKDDPEALQESISAIRSEAKSMEELVEQLLFLARGDNDTQPVKPSLFDLSALAGEVLREEEMICPDRVFLPRWGEEPVPVRADQGLIKQVMRILMDNAIKYSPQGSRIYLRLSTQERYARLTVQDEGDGIPPDSIPHIFERFYRTDQSRDRKTGGTGLGLSIARWIVERHEGWFEVVSRPGVGTRISFLLPLAPPEQEAG